MAEKPVFWNRHNDADRTLFAKFLNPLVIAAWPSPEMRRKHFDQSSASVYLISLQDVPRDILALGVSRLIEQGVTWMPKPGDVKSVCADIVDERRAKAAQTMKALVEGCIDCEGSTWRPVQREGGQEVMQRCTCFLRGVELVDQAGQAITRPALPSAQEEAEA